MSKAKKKIASVFAESKVGKSIINSTLGPEGKSFMKAIKSYMIKVYDKKKAKTIVGGIYRLSVKVKMLYDDKKIGDKFAEMLLNDVSNGVILFMDLCEKEHFSKAKLKTLLELDKRNIKGIVEEISPHVQKKNLDLLNEVLEAIVGEKNMSLLLTDDKYMEERNTMKKAFHEILIFSNPDYTLSLNARLPESKFNEQYSKEIKTCQEFWKNKVDDKERLSMSIFGKLIETNRDYYNKLSSCIYGDDPTEQYKAMINAIDFVIENLSRWETLRAKLIEVGHDRASWGPELDDKIYSNLLCSFHKAMANLFPDYKQNNVIEDFTIVLRLVVRVLEESK